ncbi:metallophosphoesterase [Holotrichia oblita]|uniref:Metallophosphoesterase n=1 Tax=Holotrichia oblita TaxID=644536 RepID=A0ACB9TRE6_HOLOL|nr:metallophosphoesterase [Holotrichia oblita]
MQSIGVHPLTEDPTKAWDILRRNQKYIKVKTKLPAKEQSDNQVRFVCMSDTHSLIHDISFDIPDGDVFIHAGNFTKAGDIEEIVNFNAWLGTLPHKHKIVISGNHELSFDPKFSNIIASRLETHQNTTNRRGSIKDNELPLNSPIISDCTIGKTTKLNAKQYLTNCIYLEDSSIELYGIKIYGSPWQPEFGNWGFNLKRGQQLLEKWDLIPDDTDILVTNTPPLGHGDLACTNVRTGCVELLTTVQKRVRPKYHVFGHIHEGYGVSTDGKIIYVNASTCDINYMPNNPAIVFDFTLPKGHIKMH